MTNTGRRVIVALEALSEFGQLTAQELADYTDMSRYDAHAVLTRVNKRTKAGEKRIHIVKWTYIHDDARRYPRAVYGLGDKLDAKKPKPNIKENRRRSEAKRNTTFRMNSVFNMAMTRDTIREIRRNLNEH